MHADDACRVWAVDGLGNGRFLRWEIFWANLVIPIAWFDFTRMAISVMVRFFRKLFATHELGIAEVVAGIM